jgi:hypothetical protein
MQVDVGVEVFCVVCYRRRSDDVICRRDLRYEPPIETTRKQTDMGFCLILITLNQGENAGAKPISSGTAGRRSRAKMRIWSMSV